MYRGLRIAARAASRISLTQPQTSLYRLPTQFQQVRTYADTIVKVPQMAESISEGTLKQFNKQVGDYVEQDEEIATIETDKVRTKCLYYFLIRDEVPLFERLSGIEPYMSTAANRRRAWIDRCCRQRSRSRHNQGVFGQRGGYRDCRTGSGALGVWRRP